MIYKQHSPIIWSTFYTILSTLATFDYNFFKHWHNWLTIFPLSPHKLKIQFSGRSRSFWVILFNFRTSILFRPQCVLWGNGRWNSRPSNFGQTTLRLSSCVGQESLRRAREPRPLGIRTKNLCCRWRAAAANWASTNLLGTCSSWDLEKVSNSNTKNQESLISSICREKPSTALYGNAAWKYHVAKLHSQRHHLDMFLSESDFRRERPRRTPQICRE